MSTQQDSPRFSFFAEGLVAGISFAIADALAAGIDRTPWRIHALTLGLGLLSGLVAGALGSLFKKRGLSLGLVLGFALALAGLSLVSKELSGSERSLAGFAIVAFALLITWACLERERGPAGVFFLIALVPLSGLLTQWTVGRGALLVGAFALPVITVLVARRRRASSGHLLSLGACAAVVGALLWAPRLGEDRTLDPERTAQADSTAAMPSTAEPDLILIVVDTLRADALPADGALARLGRNGVRFEQCISAAPWTLPSVASILTGLVPSQHGAIDAHRPLPEQVETLAETLLSGGYQTAAFTGGAFVSPTFHLDQGFEHFDADAEFGFEPFQSYVPLAWRLAKNRYFPLRALLRFVDEYPGFGGICAAAEEWLTGRDPERPYFLLLHTYEVHDYYLHHPDPDDALDRDGSELSARFRRRLSIHPGELLTAPQNDLSWFRTVYDARVAHVEAELERFLTELGTDARPRIVTVVSDHGEGFDAKRRRVHHGGRLHDDLLRVPLLMHGPARLPSGVSITEQVRTVDVAPTLLALAGIEPPPELAGSSLLPLLDRGRASLERNAWSEERANGLELRSLRRSAWKLCAADERRQFVDLTLDPLEEHPAQVVPPEALNEFDELERRYPTQRAEAVEIDAATRAHLRALGYVD